MRRKIPSRNTSARRSNCSLGCSIGSSSTPSPRSPRFKYAARRRSSARNSSASSAWRARYRRSMRMPFHRSPCPVRTTQGCRRRHPAAMSWRWSRADLLPRHAYDYGKVLIDMWVVREYSGEPRGLDGQALRWCAQDELESVDLLPADGPIVAALRLPERLRQVSTDYYAVADLGGADSGGRLRGGWCSGMAETVARSDAG